MQQLRELQVSGGVGGLLDPELVLPYLDPVVLAKHAGGAARELAERADRQSQAAEGALARAWRQLTALADSFSGEQRSAVLQVRDGLLLDGIDEPKLTESELYAAAAAQAGGELAPDRILNAEELNRTYTRLANQARQAEITQEISEIVSGADALAAASS